MLLNERFEVETVCGFGWCAASRLLLVCTVVGLSLIDLGGAPEVVAEEVRPPEIAQASAGGSEPEDRRGSALDNNGEKYQSADEAWRVGVAYYNARNFAASRAPFEAALRMASDDEFRLKVYDALRPSYRLLSKPDKMVEACEFILLHSSSDPKRSLVRRELIAFVYQRGKIDALVRRYEARLKKDKQDWLALYVLSEIYDRVKRNPRRASELTGRLLALKTNDDQPLDVATSAKLAAQYVRQKKYREGAELFEKIAPHDEQLAAWHWKEAASAWVKAEQPDKAHAAARKALEYGPDKRSQLLTHFWHRHIGEVFLQAGEFKLAAEHLQQAIDNTNIEGYIDQCQKLLAQARSKSGD